MLMNRALIVRVYNNDFRTQKKRLKNIQIVSINIQLLAINIKIVVFI